MMDYNTTKQSMINTKGAKIHWIEGRINNTIEFTLVERTLVSNERHMQCNDQPTICERMRQKSSEETSKKVWINCFCWFCKVKMRTLVLEITRWYCTLNDLFLWCWNLPPFPRKKRLSKRKQLSLYYNDKKYDFKTTNQPREEEGGSEK